MNVLFVCSGNTCRSAMAEIVLKDFVKRKGINNVFVKSCGLVAVSGDKININAKKALKHAHFEVENFTSSIIDGNLCSQADVIVAMQKDQKAFINNEKCFSAKDFIGEDIADPYGKDLQAYETALNKIINLCNALLEKLAEE